MMMVLRCSRCRQEWSYGQHTFEYGDFLSRWVVGTQHPRHLCRLTNFNSEELEVTLQFDTA